MKRSWAALALASAVLSGCQHDAVAPRADDPHTVRDPVAAASPASGDVIPGQYVVLFRRERVGPGVADATTAAAATDLATAAARLAAAKVAGAKGVVRHTFGYAVQGFAATLSDSAAAALRADPDVALVESDHVVHATGSGVQSGAPWGLDRIDQPTGPLDGLYRYANDGSGTSVYIVDTGINLTHADFGGRAVSGRDFVTTGGTATDCNGHGTHVAGIVGGATYGVAKGARLVAVRVLDCSGNGSESGVIAALDWVTQQHRAAPSTPAVVNMSLSGDPAAALDSAVARTVAAGVTVAVAAGNAGTDACTASPARAPDAITVAATDASDTFAGFSNYGACVDIAAPGVGIVSDYVGSTTATAALSGTSMASPHVAGVAALYLAANPSATPAQVTAALIARAGTGLIQSLPANTVSRLLYSGFLSPTATTGSSALVSAVAPNVCVTVVREVTTQGAPLATWACDSSYSAQRYRLTSAGALTVHDGAMCVDVVNPKAQGSAAVIWGCYPSEATQHWTLTSRGELTNVQGLCLTIAYEDAQRARPLVLWPCNGGPAQKWTVATGG